MKSPFFSVWKFAKFPISFWKKQVIFPSILHQSSVPSNITLLYFFSSNIVYFVQKEPLKRKSLRISSPKFVKFLMSILKRQVNSSSNFASFLIVMTHNSSVNFKLIHFLLWIKGSYQSPNFETFQCFGKNLQNSSCHFPNHKSVLLQVLHHSSVK